MFSIDVLHVAWGAVLFVVATAMLKKAIDRTDEFDTKKETNAAEFKLLGYLIISIGLFAVSLVWLIGFAARVIASMLAA